MQSISLHLLYTCALIDPRVSFLCCFSPRHCHSVAYAISARFSSTTISNFRQVAPLVARRPLFLCSTSPLAVAPTASVKGQLPTWPGQKRSRNGQTWSISPMLSLGSKTPQDPRPMPQLRVTHRMRLLTSRNSAGTLCDPAGELFIKPCTQKEIDFYQSANESHPDLAELMPLFIGTLMLNDATDIDSIKEQIPAVAGHIGAEVTEEVLQMAQQLQPEHAPTPTVISIPTPTPTPATPSSSDNVKWVPNGTKKIATDKAVVLENATYGYKRPNIMDVKLGVRLWADNAPLEKRQRFDKISAETTHGDLGFRIAGMRVYRGSENVQELDAEEYRKYCKDFGRVQVNAGNVADAFRRFIFNDHAKIDEELGKAVANAFLEDLKRAQEILENEESRMYSASLLFVFEGDGDALRGAIDETSASATMSQEGKGEDAGRSAIRVDSGIALDDEGELILAGEDELSDDEADIPRIYSLKLIDFAHAEWTPGQGPDENSLEGIRSLVRIFEELSR